MDSNLTQFTPREGMTVYGSDGDKVGEVDAIEPDYFIVRKGFFFPEDHYIPRSAVANFDEDNIYLAYTKDEVLSQNWTAAPEGGTWDTTTLAGTQVGDRDADLVEVDTTSQAGRDAGLDTTGVDTAYGTTDRAVDTDADHIAVPVHEEELVARKRAVDRGAVQVNKDVVTEEQSIDVPVTEEHVEVTRRNVSGDVQPDANAFQEGTIEVPVSGEEVDVEKRARVVGEVDIDKTAEQRTERVTDTVRREEVNVDDTVHDVDDNGGGLLDEARDTVDNARRRQ
jgi:uncharacterized protein (TIGR02271 family)